MAGRTRRIQTDVREAKPVRLDVSWIFAIDSRDLRALLVVLITFLAPHENLREADLNLFFEVHLADGPDRTLHVCILVELIDLILAVSVSSKRLIFGDSDGEYASFGSISFS